MTRWYIGRSGIWDEGGYPTKKISGIVKKAGGKNVRLSKLMGDPKGKSVVCFTGNKTDANIVVNAILEAMAKKRPEFKHGVVYASQKKW